MQIKRYEAANIREAMAKIKKDLGPDAIILSTKMQPGRVPLIEVMAARDDGITSPVSNNAMHDIKDDRQDDVINGLRQEIHELKSGVNVLAHNILFQRDLFDLKETLDILCDQVSVRNDAHLQEIYLRMVANGVSRTKALKLTEAIKKEFPLGYSDTHEKAALIAEKLIARSFLKDNGKERRVKALIGPTGVGKTTTLAKLAAYYSLEKKMKVGLITTDTYRIAASEQLKIYANIMGLPIEVASEKETFHRSLKSFADKDLILVDTPGRNHHDDQCLKSLKSTLDVNIESVLLLSPIATKEYLLQAADRFRIFNYDRIILTKMDECSHFGPMVDVLDKIGKPVSYMTTGQNVPKDIEKATPERLAKLMLQNRLN
jgi:flagellar biosynthesis protein FlhF